MKSKIHKVSELGNTIQILDSIVVNKEFIYSFDLEQIPFTTIHNSYLIDKLEYYLKNNRPQDRFKYQRKRRKDIIKFLSQLKEWNRDDSIYISESYNY